MSTYDPRSRTQAGVSDGGTITPPQTPVGDRFAFYRWLAVLAAALLGILGFAIWAVSTVALRRYGLDPTVAVLLTLAGALVAGGLLWVFLRFFRPPTVRTEY